MTTCPAILPEPLEALGGEGVLACTASCDRRRSGRGRRKGLAALAGPRWAILHDQS